MQNYPILLITTENYVPFAACLITSIIYNTNKIVGGGQNKPYCFYILSDFLSKSTQEKLSKLQAKLSIIYPLEITIHLCDDAEFRENNLPKLNENYLCFYRLLFERFLDFSAQKVLYLDVDMIVLWDLREIFAMDLEDKVCGVVLDYKANRLLMPKDESHPPLNLSQGYFNSGLLLIDVQKWRAQEIESQILHSMDSYHFKEHDQSILNYILKDKVKILPLYWNVLVYYFINAKTKEEGGNFNISYTRNQLNNALKNPKIVHYYLDYKPWRDDKIYVDTKGEFLGKYWWDIAQKTPVFTDELMRLKESASQARVFQAALGFLLLKFARFGLYFLLPIQAYWIMKKGLDNQASQEIPRGDYNLSIEIGKEAIKAYNKGKGRLLALPFRILNLQKRFQLSKKRLEGL
ncbi:MULTISPECIES: glycosyltransferase family 8 protein [Helicobacter]|uniref:glycosyltransferase family 8 protein n=1 Tax=Helicobacter TaxID=209 RepID=UPI00261BB65D|nr:glycosyltransferase family 8 protein [Helicobacter sp. UBA3407]